MSKNKIQKTLVEKILDKQNIKYESVTFELDNEDEKDRHNIYKTLVTIGNKTGPVVGVVPLDMHLSYKKLAKLSGNKKIGMVPLKDLVKTSGFEHGANSPVGIRSLHNYPIYIDNTALKQQTITVSAGKIGHSIIINPRDLAKSVKAEFGDFAVKEE
ncbi:aminoacyl-tRNA deacylase [Lactobacillus sp. YT155]|uniref:aminoacyl-tRNA deacylase n=1 Tax=Lactobacillus sp. YT155 TaxID=3060955 RepID=UPI00265F5FF7|nr:aminoacyl-tRNA deacylase [Lactobacillus sp. YT155]MDO1605481.1 aminoacyl-tRNA deacylase [Lactobacillus sp. YT155]